MIYHVTTAAEWQKAKKDGFYEAPSLLTEGFIHCSKKEQVAGVLERYYTGISNLLLLHIDETKLTAPLKYELAPSVHEEFPHVFGKINAGAIVETSAIN